MKLLIRQATKIGYIEMVNGGVCDLSYPTSKLRRGRVQGGGTICPTLMANESEIVRITIYEITEEDSRAVREAREDTQP